MTCISQNDPDGPHSSHTTLKAFVIGLFVLGLIGAHATPVIASTFDRFIRPWSDSLTLSVAVAPVQESKQKVVQEEVLKKTAADEEEILWLARALYSETKISWEQRLVAWVIRNRVESLRYADTYKGVVLDPKQFSGFNANDPNYWSTISLDKSVKHPAWQSALVIAEEVYYAPGNQRVIAQNVTHFYSPHAVRRTPKWAVGAPTQEIKSADGSYTRFAFYANVK